MKQQHQLLQQLIKKQEQPQQSTSTESDGKETESESEQLIEEEELVQPTTTQSTSSLSKLANQTAQPVQSTKPSKLPHVDSGNLAQSSQHVSISHTNGSDATNSVADSNNGGPASKHKKVLPLFNGDGSNIALYNSFKVKFKQYLDYYKISQSQIHSVLSDALTGDASFWFVGYTEEVPEVNGMGYKELMEILDDEYLNPLAQGKYEYDYEQLKPDYNESIEDLSKRIQKAAIRAGIKQRTNRAKKHKLFGLLADWLKQSQVNTLNDDKVSYEQFKTNLTHFREIEINKNNRYKRNWPTSSVNVVNNSNDRQQNYNNI